MKKVTFMGVDDGWFGVYFDDVLLESTDNMSIDSILGYLEEAGIINRYQVETVCAGRSLDAEISESGEFPSELDRARIE